MSFKYPDQDNTSLLCFSIRRSLPIHTITRVPDPLLLRDRNRPLPSSPSPYLSDPLTRQAVDRHCHSLNLWSGIPV